MDNYQDEKHNLQMFQNYFIKSRKNKFSPRLANSESVRRVCPRLRSLEKFHDPIQPEQLEMHIEQSLWLLPEESVHPHEDRTEEGLAAGAAFLQPDVGDVCGQNAENI